MAFNTVTSPQQTQPIEPLKSSFEHVIPETERQCMQSLDSAAALLELSILKDKKILINCHLTLSLLMMVDILIKAGADVLVTYAEDLVFHVDVLRKLKARHLFIPIMAVKKPEYKHYFDLVLDSGGYLAAHLKPKAGFIELAQAEYRRYSHDTSPVMSIDATFLKYIETSLGTGEGFVRAMRKICVQMNEDYTKKKYLFFGYGKVGKGIIHRLLQEGVQKRQITVVDLSDRAVRTADADGFRVFNITHQYDRLHAIIHHFDCAITCTGVNEAISRYFTMKDFLDVPMLINMGTYDEWGPQFPMVRVINNKKPLNYILEFPTPVCYLDPIYALMISASAHAFNRTPEEEFRVSKPPKRLQRKVLDQWLKAHQPIKQSSWSVVEKLAGTTFEMA